MQKLRFFDTTPVQTSAFGGREQTSSSLIRRYSGVVTIKSTQIVPVPLPGGIPAGAG